MDDSPREIDLLMQAWEQRRVKRPPLRAVGACVNQVVAKYGVGGSLSRRELDHAWQQVIGDRWPGATQVGGIRGNLLEITVAHSMVLQEITFAHDELLAQLRVLMPHSKIKSLAFRVGAIRPGNP